jgi:hypothetical protein
VTNTMSHEDIIRLAGMCGIPEFENNESQAENILRFAALIATKERELIAQSMDKQADLASDKFERTWALQMAAAIRASGAGMMRKTTREEKIVRPGVYEVPVQKPVAWMDAEGDVLSANTVDGTGLRNIPLYTAPPAAQPCPTCEALARAVMMDQTAHDTQRPWVGLTDDEIQSCWDGDLSPYQMQCIREMEAKLKEKNAP